MQWFGTRKYFLAGWVGLFLIGAVLVVKISLAKASIISADMAVNLALAYARSNIYVEWIDQPGETFGKVMKYGEAVQSIAAQPIHPVDEIAKMNDTLVWLIVLQGQMVNTSLRRPAHPDFLGFLRKMCFTIKYP